MTTTKQHTAPKGAEHKKVAFGEGTASAGVKLGIVKYLCLKNTVSQMRECLVLVM